MKTKASLSMVLFIIIFLDWNCKKDDDPIPPTDGLVAYYPFNGNANDESGHGNDGAVNGASLSTDRFGLANKAYSFNGIDNFIEVSNSESLEFGSSADFTFTVWAKFSTQNVSTSWFVPYFFKRGYNNSILQGYGFGTIFLKAAAEIATSWGNLSQPHGLTGNTDINDNNWHFIVMTVTRSTQNAKIFVEGIQQADLTHSSLNLDINNNSALFIATTGQNSDRYFKGYLDDIRIYNRALSESEIQELFNEGGWAK